MQKYLKWKKGIFSNTYDIYSEGKLIGKLKDKLFSQKAYGELNGKSYTFITKGFFKEQTEIRDSIDNSVIGSITYSSWKTKATLLIHNKKVSWKYDNMWNSKWSIFDSEDNKIKYSGSSLKGKIDANTDDELLILSGLFVVDYFWQKTIILVVVIFIPVWASIAH